MKCFALLLAACLSSAHACGITEVVLDAIGRRRSGSSNSHGGSSAKKRSSG